MQVSRRARELVERERLGLEEEEEEMEGRERERRREGRAVEVEGVKPKAADASLVARINCGLALERTSLRLFRTERVSLLFMLSLSLLLLLEDDREEDLLLRPCREDLLFFLLLYLLFSSSSLTARWSIMARALASFLARVVNR